MAERVDVCIVGSGFGGSIAAWRLAELYARRGGRPGAHPGARARPPLQAHRLPPVDGRRPPLRRLQPDPVDRRHRRAGGRPRTPSAAARTSTSRRRCGRRARPSSAATATPTTAPTGGCGPRAITAHGARQLVPARRARPAGAPARVERGVEVRRAVGGDPRRRRPHAATGSRWRSTSAAASTPSGATRAASSAPRTPSTPTTSRRPSAPACGCGPNRQAESVRRSQRRTRAATATWSPPRIDNEGRTRAPAAGSEEIECKVLILAAGAMGTPPILMRSRGALPSLSRHVGRHLGVNGDHVAALEYDPRKIRSLLDLPGLRPVLQGQADHDDDLRLLGPAARPPLRRHAASPCRRSSSRALTNFLYDDGRSPAGDPSFWGLQKKRSISNWNNRIELLAMVEDTMDGRFTSCRRPGAGRPPERRAGRDRHSSTTSSPSSRCACASWPTGRCARSASAAAWPGS